jgi:hypothetical protein
MAALAPPPSLGLAHCRPQVVPAWPAPQRQASVATLWVGLLCAVMAWLPLPLLIGPLCSLLAVVASSAARQKARRCRPAPFPPWLPWLVLILACGGAAAAPALSGL